MAKDPYRPCLRPQQAHQVLDKSRLARAVDSYQAIDQAFLCAEVHIVKRQFVTELAAQVLHFHNGRYQIIPLLRTGSDDDDDRPGAATLHHGAAVLMRTSVGFPDVTNPPDGIWSRGQSSAGRKRLCVCQTAMRESLERARCTENLAISYPPWRADRYARLIIATLAELDWCGPTGS